MFPLLTAFYLFLLFFGLCDGGVWLMVAITPRSMFLEREYSNFWMDAHLCKKLMYQDRILQKMTTVLLSKCSEIDAVYIGMSRTHFREARCIFRPHVSYRSLYSNHDQLTIHRNKQRWL